MGLILPQKVKIKWVNQVKEHYESRGYFFTKFHDEFEVNVEDLTPTSSYFVFVKCDYCSDIFEQKYRDYNLMLQRINPKSCCRKTNCRSRKLQESNMLKYGVSNPMKVKEFKEKLKNTNLKKYGVENPFQSDSIKEKIKKTNLEKYGTENVMQNEEIKNRLFASNEKKYGVKSPLLHAETLEKIKNTNLDRYGVENIMESKEIQDKIKQTNLERYGVDNPMKNKEIQKKAERTVKEKYGVKNVMQSEEIKTKFEENFSKKYGVKNPLQVPEFKKKGEETLLEKYGERYLTRIPMFIEQIKETNMKKYGVEYYTMSPKMKEQSRKTMYENGSVSTSKQQLYLHKLLGGELNYPVSYINLDISFPDEKIYIEYDGGGHRLSVILGTLSQEEFDQKEFKRSMFLKRLGWKEIRIVSEKDLLPSSNMLISLFQQALNHFEKDHSWYEINIDTSTIKNYIEEKKIDLGHLRKISKKDL